jgi:hypothetical protein
MALLDHGQVAHFEDPQRKHAVGKQRDIEGKQWNGVGRQFSGHERACSAEFAATAGDLFDIAGESSDFALQTLALWWSQGCRQRGECFSCARCGWRERGGM